MAVTVAASLLDLAQRVEEAPAEQQARIFIEVSFTAGLAPAAFKRFHKLLRAGAYTDAALLLVPEGWLIGEWIEGGVGAPGAAKLLGVEITLFCAWVDRDDEAEGHGRTRPLALVAAALRARAAQ